MSKYLLRLFVTGASTRTGVAIANLRRICEQELEGQYNLEIIDVLEFPELAEDEKILATPTLIKSLPLPLRRVIGDLSNSEKVLLGLELHRTTQRRHAHHRRRAVTVKAKRTAVEKIATGISSFDIIAKGGLPRNRTTLISGTAGSGKTIFAVQFIAAGIESGVAGVFVTFEESANDIRENMLSFGWDLAQWEADGKLAFVDASPDPTVDTIEAGTL